MKRARTGVVVVLLTVVGVATVSWTSGTTVRFTDAAGAPASDAYVRYHYYGYLINPVHPVARECHHPSGCSRAGHDSRPQVGHLRREYAAFLGRYGQTARRRAPAPHGGSEPDRQLWKEQTDAQLAREPLWGPYMERMWRGNLAVLAEFDASPR